MAAARDGASVLVIEVEGKSGLSTMFGTPALGYDETELAPGIRARTLTPDAALVEYLEQNALGRLSRRLLRTGAIDVVSTAVPGMKDILVLGKVKQLERAGAADLIVLDAPAAGHAITFLRSARGLVDAVKVGAINTQAQEVLDLLTDAARCRVMLVTVPEETPVNELVETAYSLEDQVGVALAPVVVNGVYPHLAGLAVDPERAAEEVGVGLVAGESDLLREAAAFRSARTELQDQQLHRMADELPLPQLHLPYLFTSELGREELDELAAQLVRRIEALPAVGS